MHGRLKAISVAFAYAFQVAFGIVILANTAVHGLPALSSCMDMATSPANVPPLASFHNFNQVTFLFVGVNGCATFCKVVVQKFTFVVPTVKLWSMLSVLPTAVNPTSEDCFVTMESVTGSYTSSSVMEFTSNQASETFQAT